MNDLFGVDISLEGKVKRAISLLKANEPPEGYYLAFSGGKDSVCILELARMSGVKYDAWYSNTTIDPPELVRFVKTFPGVKWENPKRNFFAALVDRRVGPPTRLVRWCCGDYKEGGGKGRTIIIGVRAAESKARAKRWRDITESYGRPAVCPVVWWKDEDVWEFIRGNNLRYCSLYEEGWKRLGCIGCPLTKSESRRKEFARWPRYEQLWKTAILKNWEKWKDVPRKDGRGGFQAKFHTGVDLWDWWMNENTRNIFEEECQRQILWTND